jgi:hypothetical protein
VPFVINRKEFVQNASNYMKQYVLRRPSWRTTTPVILVMNANMKGGE